jgi:hypothetical protein
MQPGGIWFNILAAVRRVAAFANFPSRYCRVRRVPWPGFVLPFRSGIPKMILGE